MAIEDALHPASQQGFFGFFECVKDLEASQGLLEAAGSQLKQWDKAEMLGPISGNTNEKVGIIVQGFQTLPQEYLAYNPPYYQQLLEGAGLVKTMDLFSYLWHDQLPLPLKLLRVAQRIKTGLPSAFIFPFCKGKTEMDFSPCTMNAWLKTGASSPQPGRKQGSAGCLPAPPDRELLLRMDVGHEPAGFCLMLPNNRKKLAQ